MSATRLMVRALPLALTLAAAFSIRGGAQVLCTPTGRDRVRDVTVTPANVQLGVGDAVRLTVTAFSVDGGVCRNGFSFSSSNVNVARVDPSGVVTALAPGVALVTLSLEMASQAGREFRDARTIVLVGTPRGPRPPVGYPADSVRLPGGVPPWPGQRPRDLPAMPRFVVMRLSVDRMRPTSDSAWIEQAALVVDRLDQTARRLVDLFRNTAGVPIAGATSPAFLSGRERFRWDVCRRFTSALVSHAVAARGLAGVPLRQVDGAAASQAVRTLAQALSATDALDECEWLSQLIASPDGAPDWGAAYTSAATRFYAGWYSDVLHVHEASRSLALAVRPLLSPGRPFDVPPALPPTPPTVGKQ